MKRQIQEEVLTRERKEIRYQDSQAYLPEKHGHMFNVHLCGVKTYHKGVADVDNCTLVRH